MSTWTPSQREALERAVSDTQTEWGSSRWATWRRCPRAHHLQYDIGLERLGSQAVHFGVGSLCHGILRYMQEGVILGESQPRNWLDVLEYASDKPDSIPEVLDESARLMKWYFAHWGLENAGWPQEAKIIAVEQHLQTPEGFAALPHTGRVDTVLEIAGTLVIVDTKTRGRSLPKDEDLEDYKRSLATRAQFLSLAAMMQMRDDLDEPPAVMVNAICKLKNPTFGRVLVQLRQIDIDRWKDDHRNAAFELAGDLAMGTNATWLRNLDSCAPEVGWRCKYFDWCHGTDESRELNFKVGGK